VPLNLTVPDTKPKTLSIGIPCWRTDIKAEFLKSLVSVLLDRDIPTVDFYIARNISVADARNEIVKRTLGEYLLMVDPDMTFYSKDVKKLLAEGRDIMAGLFFQKRPPFQPLLFNLNETKHMYDPIFDYKDNEIISVDAVGTGFMMIKRKVFQTLKEPWFVYHDPKTGLSEDLYFCKTAKENGIEIFVDTSIKIGHIGEREATERDFLDANPHLH
jgi:hypothetical protein